MANGWHVIVQCNEPEDDALGQLSSSTDAYGNVTTYLYDASGNLIETKDPGGTETRTVYDSSNQPIFTTSQFIPGANDSIPTGGVDGTMTTYNGLGQVVATSQVSGLTITLSQSTLDTSAYATAVSGTYTVLSKKRGHS